MIHKKHRFHGRGSLRFVYQRGNIARTSLASLRFVPNKRRSDYRIAVVVSRKVSKSAVVRNRIRRRVYEIIRQESTGITEPYDLIFTVFSESLAIMESIKLRNLVRAHLKRARVINFPKQAENRDHDIVRAKDKEA